jgi:ABC-type branched-subunit amino acid transport system substrate-binding protein
MRSGGLRWRALAAAVAVLLPAACGQKAGVGGADQGGVPLAAGASTTVTTSGTSEELSSGAAPAAASGTTPHRTGSAPSRTAAGGGSPTAAGGAPTARSAAAAGGGAGAASSSTTTTSRARSGPSRRDVGAAVPSDPHDKDGVTDEEIVIGIHAPLTGAAPVPQDSVDKAKDLYWRFLAERGGVFGRNIRVVFRDDQFNPSRAVAVCREMVEQEHAFLLVGIGTDQIVSCARYAAQAGIPYLSMGGSEAAVTGLRTYFTLSMSYPQQAPLVAQMVKKTGKTKVAVVVINTPNYDDTFSALVTAAKQGGLSVVRTARMSKQPSQSEVLAEANNLRVSGAEAVLLFITPVAFLNLAHAAQGQAYSPLWTGPGMSNGLNLVAEFGCPSIAGARFLSPFPQVDVIDRFDPDYKVAYRKHNPGDEPDDLGLAVWGLEKTLHQFFEAAGPDLGRARFLATLESGREFASNVFPPVRYGPSQRFGASQTHLLEADCANRRYRTLATFASSF